ncbi:MAG: hypothetical protein AABY88_02755 [Pseudomonadota bacterium]
MTGIAQDGAQAPAPSRRKPAPNRWNDARRNAFIEELYETCCVRDALKACGMSMSGLYKHRASNAAFRADWDAALDAAYAMLEDEMLDRARHGQTQEVVIKDGEVIKIRVISNRLGLALLRLHHERVAKIRAAQADVPFAEDASAVRAEIMARFERMHVHRGMKKAQAQAGATGQDV